MGKLLFAKITLLPLPAHLFQLITNSGLHKIFDLCQLKIPSKPNNKICIARITRCLSYSTPSVPFKTSLRISRLNGSIWKESCRMEKLFLFLVHYKILTYTNHYGSFTYTLSFFEQKSIQSRYHVNIWSTYFKIHFMSIQITFENISWLT